MSKTIMCCRICRLLGRKHLAKKNPSSRKEFERHASFQNRADFLSVPTYSLFSTTPHSQLFPARKYSPSQLFPPTLATLRHFVVSNNLYN